jgi:hypothetical protein
MRAPSPSAARPAACFRARAARPLAALVGLLTLAACPADGPPPIEGPDAGAGADAGVQASDYCESIVDFFCPYYLRCGRMAVADEPECRAVFLEACNARYEPTYVSLAEAGLLALSEEGIAACRAHLADVPCEEQLLDLDGPCATMWQGSQPVGAACGFDVESFTCAPGAACVLDVTFCGTCRRVVDDGERCDIGAVACKRESRCNDDGICAARRKPGESCSPQDRCVLGAVCDGDVCRGPAYVGVGEACDFERRCPYASACLEGACRAAAELSEPCGPLIPCDSGFCRFDATNEGTCVELVAQGGACSRGEQCQTGVCIEGRCSIVPSACFSGRPGG